MEKICPLCNGLKEMHMKCRTCGEDMVDGGIISNYYDDYSPYLPLEVTNQIDGVGEDQCVHLSYCPKCRNDKRIIIEKKEVR